jgi:cystathionine gamma-synthase
MSPEQNSHADLLRRPRWRPEDLGKPLPNSPHANSVCLPTWADVIGYEEKDSRVISQLQCGYPRFFLHPLTRHFFAECDARFAGAGEFCHAYPSRGAAQRALDSVHRWTAQRGRLACWSESGPFVTCYPPGAADAARKHWCHAGEGISSRRAESLLRDLQETDGAKAKQILRQRVASLLGVPENHVYLFSSGMAAIYTAYRCVSRLFPERKSVQFGFPYVDTLKVQQLFGGGADFYPRGDEDDLRAFAERSVEQPPASVFCEFPSNPLLVSPDVSALAAIAQRQGVPLVVDETLGNYVNVDLLPAADVLTTSLTKYFAGAGDVMAGSLIINHRGPLASSLQDELEQIYEDNLWGDDAILLAQYSADFPERMQRINATAERVASYCRGHAAIQAVYYPPFQTPRAYAAFRRPGGGYGGVFSVLLERAKENAPRFYNALRFCKGPNLGTNFSLCCPFTLLAHYEELDFVESCGVSRYLIRFSIGLEDPQDLIERIDAALNSLA